MRLTASRASITSSGGAVLDAIQQEDPTLDLNFEETKTLTDDVSGNNLVTFSRASSGTYVGSDGLIKTAVTDAPRFDHDPVTGESLGLLIEEARTNFSKYSRRFDVISGDSWAPVAPAAVAGSTTTAPDGTSAGIYMADTITGATGTAFNTSVVKQVYTVPNNANSKYTFSVYIKLLTATQASIYIRDGATGSVSSASVENTSDWQRVVVTSSANLTNATPHTFYIGNTDGDIAVWGSQIEKGAFSSSYITTDASTVTRSPDIASIEGTNFSSWYNQSEGTVFIDAKNYPHPVTGKALVPLAFSNNTYNNRITLAGSIGTAQFNFDVTAAGSFSRAILGNFVSSGLKASGGYKSTGSAGSLDGAAAVTSNTPNIPSVIGQLDIGRAHDGNNYLNGHISRLAYFPTRKTDQELINLTKP